jgi:hypothetical protein
MKCLNKKLDWFMFVSLNDALMNLYGSTPELPLRLKLEGHVKEKIHEMFK